MPDVESAALRQYLLDTNILLAYVRWQALAQYLEGTYQLGAGVTILTTDRDFDHLHSHLITREYVAPDSHL